MQLRGYFKEKVAAPIYKTEITAVGIRRFDHATHFYPQKLAPTSPTNGSHSVGIAHSLTKAAQLLL
jgi:hypothetical protein